MAFVQSDENDFHALREAQRMVDSCQEFADHLIVAEFLPHCRWVAYINIRTLEQVIYCVELSRAGYRIVAYDFDNVADEVANCDTVYDSAHQLLAGISPLYGEKYGFGREPLKKRKEQ
ncbi:protein GSKIP homolog [Drosophila rhopaloa]|uniref:GSKIP domain-containing protein n=1 Tax=Drosophila rhopaloa TaxID=1041015 RepID=A0ABM5I274_DRORH|nr:protein GSKIP homolog [Drosophila rhopaloa]XP_016988931.2 protein GSKIP homolog [Drosophila rhopaloa]